MLKLRYKKEILTTDYNVDSNRIISNLKFFLNESEARHIVEGNKINFKRIVRRSTHTGSNRYEAMKIFREGTIEVTGDNNKIIVDSVVQLDALIFMSILMGSMFGFLSKVFVQNGLMKLFLIGLACSLIFYILGYFWIRLTIKEIIDNSCN